MGFPIHKDFVYVIQVDQALYGQGAKPSTSHRENPHTPHPFSAGGSICADQEANEALYGQGAEPSAILGGRVRPPAAFTALYDELAAVLSGEPLESPGSLDTPADARVRPSIWHIEGQLFENLLG